MSDVTAQASEQAKFAAREFVARLAREIGGELSAVSTDRMMFAFEMGYLRGRSDGALAAVQMFDELHPKESER